MTCLAHFFSSSIGGLISQSVNNQYELEGFLEALQWEHKLTTTLLLLFALEDLYQQSVGLGKDIGFQPVIWADELLADDTLYPIRSIPLISILDFINIPSSSSVNLRPNLLKIHLTD